MGELKRRGQIWWIRYYKNGKRYEESSGSAKEAEAKSLLRLREGDIERGVALTPKVGRIRVDEAAKDVVNDYRTNRKRSLDDVERRIADRADFENLVRSFPAVTLKRHRPIGHGRLSHAIPLELKAQFVAFVLRRPMAKY